MGKKNKGIDSPEQSKEEVINEEKEVVASEENKETENMQATIPNMEIKVMIMG